MEHIQVIASAVTSTVSLVSNALNSVKSARELAKTVSDNDLKESIGAAYDSLLDLREHVLALDDENRKLKAQIAEKAAYVGPIAPHGYYYAAADGERQHPLCPVCYQGKGQVAYMTDAHDWNNGIRRECKICGHPMYEKRMDLSQRSGAVTPTGSRNRWT